jgi:hypothetical protein
MITRIASLALLLTLASGVLAAEPAEPSPELSWGNVTEHAAWKPRDSAGELVFRGKMWLLGGWFNSFGPFPNDVWSSSDGKNWTLVTPHAPWLHADLPTTVAFDDKMWIMGGWYDGRNPGASASNQVWSSTDGAEWTCATEHAGWSPRLGAGGAVLDGKLWILGGVEKYFFGDERSLRSDVWSSPDGLHWNRVLKEAPWAPRAYHAALAFDGKLWVFAGGNYLPTYEAHNDVWCSSDGLHWTRVLEKAPWAPRIWASAVVYKNHMWLLGGWSNHPSKNHNDVWYSADGKNWRQLITKNVWSPRHEQSAYVFDDKIWVAGGNPWPCTNDVWQLELPDDVP